MQRQAHCALISASSATDGSACWGYLRSATRAGDVASSLRWNDACSKLNFIIFLRFGRYFNSNLPPGTTLRYSITTKRRRVNTHIIHYIREIWTRKIFYTDVFICTNGIDKNEMDGGITLTPTPIQPQGAPSQPSIVCHFTLFTIPLILSLVCDIK